ncbi:MarR family transcriptional regulator [Putridiphycobacter roseus]|uniref:MarR family transcriptional regulator n=1 Tax=Putridiphycobacter roseus TaxID=2219161 RepID=A0A2W1NG77_9FLAO|nr:MarR family transcriptional regulator [Putridiphycobacter roseus]PZE18103.1 MarR family transcriptional regulator [Putridiphycobacter roseus]
MQLILYYFCAMLPKDFKDSLAPNLGRTVKMMEHRVDHMLTSKGFDLTKMQFLLLHKLQEHDGVNQNDLAMFSNRNKSSLTRAINVLEKKNYLARIPSKEDKRVNHLFITKAGLQILDQTSPVFNEMSGIIQKGFKAEELKLLINMLKRIQANVNEDFATHTFINSNKNQ